MAKTGNELNYEDYLLMFENFIKSHKRVYYSLNQVRENDSVKIFFDKTITVQCQYLTNLYEEVSKLPVMSTKQNLLDSIKKYCLRQNDKFILEKTYNILYNIVYNLKSDFLPVTINSLRIINLSNSHGVEIEHVKYYKFIIDYIDDTLNEIDRIFTTKSFIVSKQTTTQPPPPKKTNPPTKTPKILDDILDDLFDRLKDNELKDCKKTDFNKLFNGADTNTIKIDWIGSIGLLKNLFKELHTTYNFDEPQYYKNCFQFTKEQYNNNKISKKDESRTKELLK